MLIVVFVHLVLVGVVELAEAVATPVGSVLWFLGAYALIQALAPWLALVVLFAGFACLGLLVILGGRTTTGA